MSENPAQQRFRADLPLFPSDNGFHPATGSEQTDALDVAYHGATLPNQEEVAVGTPGCQRCEVLPSPLIGPGELFLQLPHTYTLGKVLDYLSRSPFAYSETRGTVCITVRPGQSLAPLLSPLLERMSSIEQRDTRAWFKPETDILSQAMPLHDMVSLPELTAKIRGMWLLQVLREKRVHSLFQPILDCQKTGFSSRTLPLFGYEALMRAHIDGGEAQPLAMLEMARACGLLFALDLAARRSALIAAGTHKLPGRLFINFSPNAVYNPKSCLNSTVRLVDELGLVRANIVFEIVESEQLPELAHLRRIVDFYHNEGFRVALDDVGSGFSTLSLLLELKPDFVKIDRSLICRVHELPQKAMMTQKLLEVARHLELTTIAEGIETEEELAWVQNQGAELAQGYLFARPGLPPLTPLP